MGWIFAVSLLAAGVWLLLSGRVGVRATGDVPRTAAISDGGGGYPSESEITAAKRVLRRALRIDAALDDREQSQRRAALRDELQAWVRTGEDV